MYIKSSTLFFHGKFPCLSGIKSSSLSSAGFADASLDFFFLDDTDATLLPIFFHGKFPCFSGIKSSSLSSASFGDAPLDFFFLDDTDAALLPVFFHGKF